MGLDVHCWIEKRDKSGKWLNANGYQKMADGTFELREAYGGPRGLVRDILLQNFNEAPVLHGFKNLDEDNDLSPEVRAVVNEWVKDEVGVCNCSTINMLHLVNYTNKYPHIPNYWKDWPDNWEEELNKGNEIRPMRQNPISDFLIMMEGAIKVGADEIIWDEGEWEDYRLVIVGDC